MEFYQAINNRRTVRDLTAEPIPVDVLERIIAAGIQAPTYDHRREWEFVILREELAGSGNCSRPQRLYASLLDRSWLSVKRRCRFRAGGASSNKHAAFWQMVKRR